MRITNSGGVWHTPLPCGRSCVSARMLEGVYGSGRPPSVLDVRTPAVVVVVCIHTNVYIHSHVYTHVRA